MTTDERVFGFNGPVALLCVQVGVAHAGVGKVDKTFAWLKLCWLNNGLVCALLNG